MIVDRLTGLLGQFELDGATSLSLADGRSVDRISMWSNILDLEADDVATAKLAVDRQIEQRQVPRSISDLKARADGPNVLGLQRRLCTGQPAFVPKCRASRPASRRSVSMVALLSAKSEAACSQCKPKGG
jgi:hypothetical protein